MTEILQYIPRNGLFHHLHPVTKLLFLVLVIAISVMTMDIQLLIALLTALVLIAAACRILREVLGQFVLIAVMSVVLITITVLTVSGGEVLFYLIPVGVPLIGGSIPVTIAGLEFGVVLTLRFAAMICAFQLFVLSTQPRDLVHTFERMHMPVDYVLMFLIALRFIPTLQIEGVHIHEAQLARGYNPGEGVRGRAKSMVPIMVPLVSNALARSNVLGLTIDLRGYRTRTRTPMRERHMNRMDVVAVTGICMVAVAFTFRTFSSLVL